MPDSIRIDGAMYGKPCVCLSCGARNFDGGTLRLEDYREITIGKDTPMLLRLCTDCAAVLRDKIDLSLPRL